MAVDTSLEGLRSNVLDSIKGRKLGLNPSGYLQGQLTTREVVAGVSAAGSTILSSATAALTAYGVSLVGSTGTSAATSYTLADPVPGVRKMLFNTSTGTVTVTLNSTAAGQGLVSTGSVTSTLSVIAMAGKGGWIELIGLTTSQYGVLGVQQISTGGTGITLS